MSGAPTVTPVSVDAMVDVVREALATTRPLRIVGAEQWAEAGHLVRAETTVRCTALRGISHYTPGDLTLSCGAGTTLAELDEATRANGQWCRRRS